MGNSRHRQTRHPQPFPGVYQRSKIDKHSGEIIPLGKWLPRMKPPREQLSSGKKLIHDHLPLGGYNSPEEAKKVRDIAAFYYGKAEGELTLANGQAFSIPSMSEQEKQSLQGVEKRQWVCRRAREVFEDFNKALKAAPSMRNGALVSSEAATAVVATSPEITGSQHLTDQIFDIGCDFDIRNGFPPALDLLRLPSLSRDEGGALGSTSQETTSLEVKLCESQCQILELQRQLDEALMQNLELQRQLDETVMPNLELQRQLDDALMQNLELQRQLDETLMQNLEFQRQLDETLMQNLELQREMECVKSELRQYCFCLQEPYWIP